MLTELSWKVGGQQGEGVESTGETFAVALNRQGYYIYSFRHFSSRIKGGHSNDKVRVSLIPHRAIASYTDILLAFDQETIDLNASDVREGGIVIADAKFKPTAPQHVQLVSIPLTQLAEENGSAIMKNMVSLGASCYLLGLSLNVFRSVIEEKFSRKGAAVVEQNMRALQSGYDAIREQATPDMLMPLAPADGVPRLFMMGNDALGLGALAAGARVMAAYPITPASDVMEYLIKKMPKVGGAVVQTEDEIAAMTMTIGANYGGARAFTCTSGPGLALMMEAIGLSGMTETPTVIIDTQRGGPSTGLPTKQEQSDFLAALFGTHGEIPKIVLTPATPEECFQAMGEAFNLAEQYQCPVIVMTDLQLSLSKQTTEPLKLSDISIQRGSTLMNDIPSENIHDQFKRYELTANGVSPRVLPGTKGGLHHVTGVEHSEIGRPNETSLNRQKMMEKRMRKLQGVELNHSVSCHGNPNAKTVLLGIGSNFGALEEAVEILEKQGISATHVHIHKLLPFPVQALQEAFAHKEEIFVVENNATGQIRHLLGFFNVSTNGALHSILKFDGSPFLPKEIAEEVARKVSVWQA
ncbi:2-oxoacid:acceptor oxidoreductase subunit alpha [Alicyclobacillus sp. TC]|uniref:2-oxoacid:acceptor oxidoreductase subunit alpha n=1 Tax=Alicyclobacillus sp. TC TaxID=2606450 RepID=UPI001933F1F0|nr:2-oxoacid:acceptor oxidoreductase subunit alpha [Alicyclobacillus sp. TC]QRF23938.1 2-oxoacid:acceptor oxidoreductase subunit alpha [Alicyclobacillus sp. TC]